MTIDYIAIGKRVKYFRILHGLSQEKAAELSDLTPAHFSHIETGNTKVSLPSLMSIANSLDVTMDDLLADGITHTKHVSMKAMNILLEDCTDRECQALYLIMEAGKEALRIKE